MHQLSLQLGKHTLGRSIVGTGPNPSHAHPQTIALQALSVRVAGALTPIIGMQNRRFPSCREDLSSTLFTVETTKSAIGRARVFQLTTVPS